MVDQNKIILMTKLAIYDKNYGKEDARRSRYYLEDYLYTKNFKTRFSVTLVVLLFMGLNIMKMINEELIIPTSVPEFIQVYIGPYIIPWIVVLVIYTLISTGVYGKRYAMTQKRTAEYKKLLKKLAKYEQDKSSEEGAENEGE